MKLMKVKKITVAEYMKPWLDPFEANVLSGGPIVGIGSSKNTRSGNRY